MLDFPSIVSSPDVCGGSPCLNRTRIPVWTLVRLRELGLKESEILNSYPGLSQVDLEHTWAYADQHRLKIDREIAENEE